MNLLEQMTQGYYIIFSVGFLMIMGVMATKFSSRLGVPSLVLFIIVGMFLGDIIYYDNAFLTQLFGTFALIVILFEGGSQTNWENIRPILKPAISLATLGVLLTAIIIGVFSKWLLGLSWVESMLFGAIVGSTDAAAVFAAMGGYNIVKRLSATLEAESGLNDPMAIFLTISLIQWIQASDTIFLSFLLNLFLQMAIGGFLGLLFGKLAVWGLNRIQLDSSGLYPVLALAFAIITFSITSIFNGSGLLAVYVMAIIIGNSDIAYRQAIFRFNEGFAWMMQIFMFILLGWLVFPEQLQDIVWVGLALSILLMFVARPVGVWLSTWGYGYQQKEKLFIAWAGLRGAVPIVLATYPLLAKLPNSNLLFNTVFFVVITSAVIQGSTINWLGRKLEVIGEEVPKVSHTLELVSLGKANAEIVEFTIVKGMFVADKQVNRLSLPQDVLITAVIRNNEVVTPKGDTLLLPEDTLYILVPKKQKEYVQNLFTVKTPVEGKLNVEQI